MSRIYTEKLNFKVTSCPKAKVNQGIAYVPNNIVNLCDIERFNRPLTFKKSHG